jgi:hypothetical protein
MPKRYNTRLIRQRHSYDLEEIAELLNKDKRTCFRWIDEGLKVIDADSKPLLVMGNELKRFLEERRNKNKVSLKENEYFCLRCKKAVKAKLGSEQNNTTGKNIGKNNKKQIMKTGLCEVCGGKICKLC